MEPKFWAAFNDFEVHHGNEDTFREMLRLKRSVSAQFTEVTLASGDLMRGGDMPADPMAALDASGAASGAAAAGGAAGAGAESDTMAALEQQAAELDAATAAGGGSAAPPAEANPEEIDLDDEEDDDDDGISLTQKEVPAEVFGASLLAATAAGGAGDGDGALERLAKRAKR
eukprot:SAG11_NODE_46_length_20454_cov_11.499386_13_plen_172_part_00